MMHFMRTFVIVALIAWVFTYLSGCATTPEPVYEKPIERQQVPCNQYCPPISNYA